MKAYKRLQAHLLLKIRFESFPVHQAAYSSLDETSTA